VVKEHFLGFYVYKQSYYYGTSNQLDIHEAVACKREQIFRIRTVVISNLQIFYVWQVKREIADY
jgi:hypothetical protein